MTFLNRVRKKGERRGSTETRPISPTLIYVLAHPRVKEKKKKKEGGKIPNITEKIVEKGGTIKKRGKSKKMESQISPLIFPFSLTCPRTVLHREKKKGKGFTSARMRENR